MPLTVKTLEPRAERAWDRFVQQMPAGTFFHLASWREVIERVFHHRAFYAYAERDGALVGVLPLAQVKTILFGNALIAAPFCVYGGPLAAEPEAEAALTAHAIGLMETSRATVLEYRCREPAPSLLAAGDWACRDDLYATFRKPIGADDEVNMKAIPRKQRAMVRKALQNGLTSVSNRDWRTLHRVYAESVRNLGTPVFPRRYFEALTVTFRDVCDVTTVLDGSTPVAAVLNFYFRDQVLPYYGGGTELARTRAANDFMYWEVMRRAAARGARLFDFGRSKFGTGAFAFKKNWGFEPQPLPYYYKLAPGAALPDHNPLNPKYRLFIAGWKRLPLPVANVVGPFIVRGLG
jgi:FemAB-related protein (PEP-CTERM system-associated)